MRDYGYDTPKQEVDKLKDIQYTCEYLTRKGLTKDTHEFYSSVCRIDEQGKPFAVEYPYHGGEGMKVRNLVKKGFHAEGDMSGGGLFGRELFSSGMANSITITEGEDDAMAVFQMLGSKWPSVSVKGAGSAARDCVQERDFINSFDKIYLCFDSDEPGQKVVSEVARLFDITKIYHVKMDKHKDACEYLVAGDAKEFVSLWWNSKKFLPKGILNGVDEMQDILTSSDAEAIATYPFPHLNEMTYGIRSQEVNLITAQEKMGKTEFLGAIEHHLLKTTDYNIGIIHLEETEKRCVQRLVNYELGEPVHLPDCTVSVSDQLNAFERATNGNPDRVYLYKHFGSDDPDHILDVLRYLVAACGCKFIFLDHITMVVTGHKDDGDERKKLDYLSTKMAEMVMELDFTLFLVSHVNDDGKTRGSRNISKAADLILHLERNLEGKSIDSRNTTQLMVKGNRFGGLSGPSTPLWFDPKSLTMSEMPKDKFAEPEAPW